MEDLRREVRELSCELQDAKDLLFSERSLRESTLSAEALAVIELSDQITMYCAQISQIRALLNDVSTLKRYQIEKIKHI
ncbi:unnamed protein product [Toxocara canis]|uniref:Uncharacterized protein n=1 Tax=Toxocara canis TaxID=6265 RepID=A0A3P7GMJ3_TOXCA|nr:unnamed protein product [Toxocara canis]